MAKKRMFNNEVLDTDAFLDMPLSTQALYFHLCMRADDDGFIGNPTRIQKYIGASEDDLKLLVAKRFVLVFDDGVIVIKHWRMHNTIQKDRYKQTNYVEDLAMLGIKENRAYTLNDSSLETKCFQNVSSLDTKCKQNVSSDIDIDLGLDIDIDNKGLSKDNPRQSQTTDEEKPKPKHVFQNIVDAWNDLQRYGIRPIRYITDGTNTRCTLTKARVREHGEETVLECIELVKDSDFLLHKMFNGKGINFDWFVCPSNFQKVLDGNYSDKKNTAPQKETGGKSCRQ